MSSPGYNHASISYLKLQRQYSRSYFESMRPRGGVKDPEFYRSNGDTVLMVQRTLFKIHRSCLTERGDAVLQKLLEPTKFPIIADSDGSEDERPILLNGEADGFRALCWILYTLPPDDPSAKASTQNLLSLISVCHIHDIHTLEKWAVDCLVSRFRRHYCCCASDSSDLNTCSEDVFEKLVELSNRHEGVNFRSEVENRWIGRLELGTLSMQHALDFGERTSAPKFMGRAYYVAAVNLGKRSTTGLKTARDIPTWDQLSDQHYFRIIEGVCSLTAAWDRICQDHFTDDTGMMKVSIPTKNSHELPTVDILGRLLLIFRSLGTKNENGVKDVDGLRETYLFSPRTFISTSCPQGASPTLRYEDE